MAPATRREQILDTAAALFARRGFHGVSVTDIGTACGISGPALYKHFASKDALLAEMLISISEELLAVGADRSARAASPRAALVSLIEWHLSFAIDHRPLIVVQDRDWSSLPASAREQVRRLQRAYVDLWAQRLREVDGTLTLESAHAAAHGVFGMLNSTPRGGNLDDEDLRAVLRQLALRACGVSDLG